MRQIIKRPFDVLAVRNISFLGIMTVIMLLSPCSVHAQDDAKPVLRHSFKQVIDSIIVPIKVNGGYTVDCILDTGMPQGLFLMRPQAAQQCDLSFMTTANVRGAGKGGQAADVDLNATLALDGLQWNNQRVISLRNPGRLAHLGVDGAFGSTLFEDYVVQLDFENEKLSIFKPNQFMGQDLGQMLKATVRNTKLYVNATIVLDDKPTPVELLLDTGANKGISINPSPNGRFHPPKPVLSTYLGSGVGGDIHGSIGRLEELRLGDLVLTDVAASFPDFRGVDGDGSIGLALLRKFNVTIDYPNERIFLKPNQSFEKPTEFTMTGLGVAPNETGKLMVHSIVADSPAEEAGLEKGDEVLKVNDQKISFARFSDLELDVPGKTLRLQISREGKVMDKKVITRRLR